jgi:protocatechuate 3,4-dioxygenase beta subunit
MLTRIRCTLRCVVALAATLSASASLFTVGQDSSGQDPSTSLLSGDQADSFELIVVGPHGERVPRAGVEVRSPYKKWQVKVGEVVRGGTYGVFMQADEQGRLVLVLPQEKIGFLNLSIEAPGYGLFWAAWSFSQKSEKLPQSYTAHLDGGQSFGGIVVDSEGNPVTGAQVHPSIEYKKRDGDLRQLGSGKTFKSDAEGRWRVDTVPATEEGVRVQITHPDFMPTSLSLDIPAYGLKLDEIPSRHMVLERGQTVAGVVSDLAGRPIAGAIVRARIQNETLEASADAAGCYALKNCQMGATELVVTAQGFAPDLKQVDIGESTPAVDFRLELGRTIRVRVTDRDGNPLSGARIFFQNWRGKSHDDELGMVHAYTGEGGVWLWENAPADAVTVDICPPNAMQVPDQSWWLVRRNFTLPPRHC